MQSIFVPPAENRFVRLVQRVRKLPVPRAVQRRVLSFAVGQAVPYLATSSIELEGVERGSATLFLRNRRKVQNHMQTVHASAMFLLAEAATGVVLSANLPDGSKFATTHAAVDYRQKSVGDLRAVARLSPEQIELLWRDPSGRLTVPVIVTDERGEQPAQFTVEWSWKHSARR